MKLVVLRHAGQKKADVSVPDEEPEVLSSKVISLLDIVLETSREIMMVDYHDLLPS